MKNKILALILSLVLVVSIVLVGCGGNNNDLSKDQEEDNVVIEQEAEAVEEPAPEPEPDPIEPLNEIYQQYIADGDFTDFGKCGYALGADRVQYSESSLTAIYFDVNDWAITISTDRAVSTEPKSYVIAIGNSVPGDVRTMEDRYQRVHIEKETGNLVKVFDTGEVIDLAVLDYLPAVMYYCLNNPYPEDTSNVNPVEGILWEGMEALDRI